ncbi:Gfo/Idh/MocA family protein [Nonomuraea sp. NPDC050790]|uniref:Gfo/Idh/MocA family protein n=1 Tax=Nonomuraea sp. NPDC050790 TaxID=3364371 RepID=UPI0037AB00CF
MVTLAVVGAGLRATGYARLAREGGLAEIVAVAEPDPGRRADFAAEHGIPAAHVFSDWQDLLAGERLADAVIVATQDRLHLEPAVRAAELGYHILLEKPMAPTEEDAAAIAAAADRHGVILAVCHVLRYAPYTTKLMEILAEGRIGRIMNIQHLEQVGWWHQAHSFVRGNWRNEAESAPMLLAKACHDLDWIVHVKGQVPERVSSFGNLVHFTAASKPAGATPRCLDCPLEPTCPYSAKQLYLDCLADPARHFWPLGAITRDFTEEGVFKALREGPYGRCVYDCDNDVVDSQVVIMEFADGTSATCTMTAFGALEHRKTKIFGTHGSIDCDGETLRVHDFLTDKVTVIDALAGADASAASGHGGGDLGLIEAFVAAVREGDPALIPTDAHASLATHRVVWAAEQARHTQTVVSIGKAPHHA